MWIMNRGALGAKQSEPYIVGQDYEIGVYVDENFNRYPIYRKVVDCGQLTNASSKTVAHGISGEFRMVSISGVMYGSNKKNGYPLPLVTGDINNTVYLAVGPNNITISPSSDRSSYTAIVVLEYYLVS